MENLAGAEGFWTWLLTRYGLLSQMSDQSMDDISEARLKEVHPLLAGKIREMANLLGQQGITIRVIQGLRTWEDQARLYDQGRNPPSDEPIVTNAPPGFSYHNFGLAVDVVPMMPLGPDWNVNHPVWGQIVQMGRSVGLEAGATWRTFKDYPHFQLTGNLPLSPNQEVRATFATGGISAVWDLTGYGKPLENSQEQDV